MTLNEIARQSRATYAATRHVANRLYPNPKRVGARVKVYTPSQARAIRAEIRRIKECKR